jgi:serine/threonine-protein kinase
VLLTQVVPGNAGDIAMFDLAKSTPTPGAERPPPTSLIGTPFLENNAEPSPDGRWIAYESNESGTREVYVRPLPNVNGGRWQISSGGGTRAAWSRNGRELFYLDANDLLTAVAVQATSATFNQGNPVKVLSSAYFTGSPQRTYDVTRDGQKFLMIKEVPSADRASTPPSIVVVLNWTEELKQRVPTR